MFKTVRGAAVALFVGFVVMFSGACAPAIGDDCETNVECDTGAGESCDVSAPQGYCTLSNCTPNSCPNSAICIQFDAVSSYCMKYCEEDGDCREGYSCRKDKGDQGFCYVPAPATMN